MHLSLDGFVAGLNGEMDWIKGTSKNICRIEDCQAPFGFDFR